MTSNPFVNTTSGLAPNAGVLGTPGAITSTSSTSQLIQDGVMQFQIQAQCAFAPGMFVSIVNQANAADWMIGSVVSYNGTTLTVDVINTNGAGTFASWYINLSGPVTVGATGPAGSNGAAGAAAGPLNGSVVGLKLTNDGSTPSTKADITALAAVMVNSSGTSLRATSVSVVVDLTTGTSTSSANGMDGEGPGTSGWVYFYLINNGTTTAGLATKTAPTSGSPTLPSGYTSSVYVGAMYVDGSGNLLRTSQGGKRTHYVVTASTNTANLPVMGNGSAGSTSTPTWVGITLAGFVPATASQVLVSPNCDVGGTATTVLVAPNNAYGNATSTNPPPVAVGTGSVISISPLPIESTSIYWASGGTDGYLLCVGWDDYCVAA
jgi:hypothetical protein